MHVEGTPLQLPRGPHGAPEAAQVRVHQLDSTVVVHQPDSEPAHATPEVQHPLPRLQPGPPLPDVHRALDVLGMKGRRARVEELHPVRVFLPVAGNAHEVVEGWVGLDRQPLKDRVQHGIGGGIQKEAPDQSRRTDADADPSEQSRKRAPAQAACICQSHSLTSARVDAWPHRPHEKLLPKRSGGRPEGCPPLQLALRPETPQAGFFGSGAGRGEGRQFMGVSEGEGWMFCRFNLARPKVVCQRLAAKQPRGQRNRVPATGEPHVGPTG